MKDLINEKKKHFLNEMTRITFLRRKLISKIEPQGNIEQTRKAKCYMIPADLILLTVKSSELLFN